MVQLLNIQW